MSGGRKTNGAVRPIRTRRDYKGAESIVKTISGQAERESAAEKRLQSLIKEMERFDGVEDEDADASSDDGYSGPRRRWSDDSLE